MHAQPPNHPDRERSAGQVVYRGAGLTVRAYTAAELRARLGHTTPDTPAPAAPTPAGPTPAALVSAGGARAGASAWAEYRRRRAAELARWSVGLPWRAGLVAACGLAGQQLTAHAALPRPWLAGLLAAASGAWRLRFRPSQPTRAWRDGARGERATARRLHRLQRHGYTVLHDLQVPGSHANLDHLAIGPAGVFVIDSKRYRGQLWLGPDGMLWYAGYPLAQQLATVVWAAMRLAEALQLPPEVPVQALMVVHRASVPWGGLTIAGVQVIPPKRPRRCARPRRGAARRAGRADRQTGCRPSAPCGLNCASRNPGASTAVDTSQFTRRVASFCTEWSTSSLVGRRVAVS
jgi:Nuclease-related domain